MDETPKDAVCKPIDILLVEDSDDDVQIALRAFRKARLNNNVFVVRDGQEALDYIYRVGKFGDTKLYPRPDLILLDINLPKLNGFQVLEKVKADPKISSIPVILLTSSKNEEDIIKGFGEGAASFIQKPIHFEEFVKVVDAFNFYWQCINRLPSKN